MKFKEFKPLASYLDSIDNINYGGCGISAYFIYSLFKEQKKKPEIVFLYSPGSCRYDENNEALKGNGHAQSCNHVMVKVGDTCYDSEGEHKFKDLFEGDWAEYEHYHIVNKKFLLEAIKKGRWNSMFDRDQEVPKMEKKIGINLPVK